MDWGRELASFGRSCSSNSSSSPNPSASASSSLDDALLAALVSMRDLLLALPNPWLLATLVVLAVRPNPLCVLSVRPKPLGCSSSSSSNASSLSSDSSSLSSKSLGAAPPSPAGGVMAQGRRRHNGATTAPARPLGAVFHTVRPLACSRGCCAADATTAAAVNITWLLRAVCAAR